MPDNLTRYRVVAYAGKIPKIILFYLILFLATEKLFGLGESNMVAELPVMIRPSPPRFFNFGDVTNISTVVQNQLNEQIDLVVGLRATNASINGSNCWKFSLGPCKFFQNYPEIPPTHISHSKTNFFNFPSFHNISRNCSLPILCICRVRTISQERYDKY